MIDTTNMLDDGGSETRVNDGGWLMWDEIIESNFRVERCNWEFVKLLTLNSFDLIPQLERKGIVSNKFEVGFLFNGSY